MDPATKRVFNIADGVFDEPTPKGNINLDQSTIDFGNFKANKIRIKDLSPVEIPEYQANKEKSAGINSVPQSSESSGR